MKHTFLLLCLITMLIGQKTLGAVDRISNQPDSVYLFSYATEKNANHNGLHFAWSTDQENWKPIGPEYRFLFCDYGRWGSEKRTYLTPHDEFANVNSFYLFLFIISITMRLSA